VDLFVATAVEHGCGNKWGLFASYIPHRVGYQCSAFYRTYIVPRGLLRCALPALRCACGIGDSRAAAETTTSGSPRGARRCGWLAAGGEDEAEARRISIEGAKAQGKRMALFNTKAQSQHTAARSVMVCCHVVGVAAVFADSGVLPARSSGAHENGRCAAHPAAAWDALGGVVQDNVLHRVAQVGIRACRGGRVSPRGRRARGLAHTSFAASDVSLFHLNGRHLRYPVHGRPLPRLRGAESERVAANARSERARAVSHLSVWLTSPGLAPGFTDCTGGCTGSTVATEEAQRREADAASCDSARLRARPACRMVSELVGRARRCVRARFKPTKSIKVG
jgi:hypothetical protein